MKSIKITILIILSLPFLAKAQENNFISQDSARIVHALDSIEMKSDLKSIANAVDTSSIKLKPKFSPDPKKSIIYSIIPGLGQVYNRKYWKLPIVYGGFLGCVYAMTWNGSQYNQYKNASADFNDKDNTTNSWVRYKPKYLSLDVDTWTSSDVATFTNNLQRGKDYYRRYRDLSYFITAGLYALTMIDAYVDAQLFDFDISQDLGMRVEPVIFDKSSFNSRSVGLQCSFRF